MKDKKRILIISIIFVVFFITVAGVVYALSNKDNNYDEVIVKVSSNQQSSSQLQTNASKDKAPYDLKTVANRAFELKYLFAVDNFNTPNKISVNVLVQYAFCHLYFENLASMPESGIILRETTSDKLNNILKEHFNLSSVKVEESDLYNISTKKFEMWQPNYGTDVFYDTKTSKIDDSTYETDITFYQNSSKTAIKGQATVTVKKTGKTYTIQTMK